MYLTFSKSPCGNKYWGSEWRETGNTTKNNLVQYISSAQVPTVCVVVRGYPPWKHMDPEVTLCFFRVFIHFSFVSKSYHRIYFCRPPRWDVTGEQGHGEEQESDAEEGGRVGRLHLIEQSP